MRSPLKILIGLLLSIAIFFFAYNIYLKDRPLMNLRIVQGKIGALKALDEAGYLVPALDFCLSGELASEKSKLIDLVNIALARDILANPKAMPQLDDVKFVLSSVIEGKERHRPRLLLVLDKVNGIFASLTTEAPKARLQNKVKLSRRLQFNLAFSALLEGNLDEAIRDFIELSAAQPLDDVGVFSFYEIAEGSRMKKDFSKALALYNQVAAEDTQPALAQVAQLQLGYLYLYELKDYELARGVFVETKAQFANSKFAEHIERTSLPSIGKAYRKDGIDLLSQGYKASSAEKYKEAIKKCDRALEINPGDGAAYSGKSLAHLWLKETDKAVGFAKEAVKVSPKDEMANVNLGYVYIQLGLIDEAIKEYKRFIATNPFTSRGYYNLGFAYTTQEKYPDAYNAFHQARIIDPQFSPAFNNEGFCLWQLDRFAEAIEVIERSLVLDSKSQDALFNLGLIYTTTGEYEKAKTNLKKVLELDPRYPKAKVFLEKVEDILKKKRL